MVARMAERVGGSPDAVPNRGIDAQREFEVAGRAGPLELVAGPPIPAEARADLLVTGQVRTADPSDKPRGGGIVLGGVSDVTRSPERHRAMRYCSTAGKLSAPCDGRRAAACRPSDGPSSGSIG